MNHETWRDSFDPQNRDERTTNMMYAYEEDAGRLKLMQEEYDALATALENATHLIVDEKVRKQFTEPLGKLEEIIIGLENHVDDLKNVLEGKGIDVA